MTNMLKQYEVLKWASLFLEENNCEQNIGELLLQHHLDVSRSEFYMMMQEVISPSVVDLFKRDIQKHVETGIPIQHLMGYEYFYGRKFLVNQHTLIPRPETEELVQHVIEWAKDQEDHLVIIDVGTGSGIIAITLALEMPNVTVYATDISSEALEVARNNASLLDASVTFMEGNFLQPAIDEGIGIDVLVSNPPYIASSEKKIMSRTVKDFDPALALFAEEEGLAAYKEILEMTTRLKSQVKMIALEIGYQQGDAVQSVIKEAYPQGKVKVIQDINNKNRIVSAEIPV